MGQKFHRNLYHVSKINAFLHFMQKLKMAAIHVEIALSHTIIEINAFLRYTQKFKMAAKHGGENNFWEKSLVKYADTLPVTNFVKNSKSLYITALSR